MWRTSSTRIVPALARVSNRQTPGTSAIQRCLCTKPPGKAEAKPAAAAKPAEAKPAAAKPAEAKPAEAKPAEAKAKPAAEAKSTPPPPPPSGGGGGLKWLLGLTVLGGGGVVGYALYDEKFRQQMEKTVPYSKNLLDAISKYLPEKKEQKPRRDPLASGPIVDQPEKAIQQGLARTIKPDMASVQPAKTPKPLESPVLDKKQQERDKVKRALEAKQMEEAAENAAMEEILHNVMGGTVEAVRAAIEAEQDAARATKAHSMQLKKAMEDTEAKDKTILWESVTGAFDAKKEAVETAEKALELAKMDIEKLRHAVQEGKANAITKKNPALRGAEETLNHMVYDLKTAEAQHEKAKSEAKLMQEYRDLIKKGKEQFKRELESIMPDVKIGGRFGKMTEDELNSLIAHAHRRIEQLQRQLAEQQALERVRLDSALARQQQEDEKLADQRIQREQERLRAQFNLDQDRQEVELGVKHEEHLRQQLTRQAAAHSDHLAQVLKVQEAEVHNKYEALLQTKLIEENKRLRDQIATWIARLRGIEEAVVNRAEMEKQGRKAQELWLACQTLHNLIRDGKEGARDLGEEQLKPLTDELTAIKAAGNDNTFVNTLTESFPEQACQNGVWTQDALVERFQKVDSICRRVAMIDESGGTLFQYLLSYLQALFVFKQRALGPEEDVDPDALTPFTILDNASRALEHGDFEQALRFMNQLKGESRKAAGDWIVQARLHLETKQAADALLAFASATGLGNLF